MTHQSHPHHGGEPAPKFWRSRYAVGLLVFGAVALFFLLGEHRAHALGVLPFLLLLACPLLHVFMHRGHGHASARRHGTSAGTAGDKPAPTGGGGEPHRPD